MPGHNGLVVELLTKEIPMTTVILTACLATVGIAAAIIPVLIGVVHHYRDEADRRMASEPAVTPALVDVS